ncbi:TCP-1-like chaperonin intermediate domain superfamily [Sesbania bispinosa]|nr:TCP-1-like chaperonin intermediate domain superfamily [Sesbania bispinosa]
MAIDRIFKDEASEEKGERARMASFVGAMAIADLVKTTLGPKGMDKILQSTGRGHEVTVTNDGATILKSLHIDNPAAKVLVDISKVQDDEVGDGTTSVVVLAGELLREAEKLVAAKIHPMTIISGFRMAAECARNSLLQKVVDNKADADSFLTRKWYWTTQTHRECKDTGGKHCYGHRQVKIYGARVRVDSMAKVAEMIEGAEKEKMREKELFADAGILAIEHADLMVLSVWLWITDSFFWRCNGAGIVQIVLRGASHHVLDEAERSLHDALCVLSQTVNDSRVLLGGGWPEMVMAKELRAEHQKEGCTAGIDVITGSVGDMAERGISEAFKVKQAVLLSATEAAEMILRVDEIITCAPRRREDRMRRWIEVGGKGVGVQMGYCMVLVKKFY